MEVSASCDATDGILPTNAARMAAPTTILWTTAPYDHKPDPQKKRNLRYQNDPDMT